MKKIRHLISVTLSSLFGHITPKWELEAGKQKCKQRTFMELCGTSQFFWPNITRENVELALRDRPDGTFLVKSTYNGPHETMELCYKREGDIMTMFIEFNERGFSLDHSNTNLPRDKSLDGLIQTLMSKCKNHSLVVADETKQNFGLVKLKFPLKRNITLMDHCRKAVLSSHPCIESLDLPRELTTFLVGERQVLPVQDRPCM